MLAVPHPYENGVAEQWISTHQEAFASGQQVHFAAVMRDGLALWGSISLVINQRDNNAALGYWIGLPYWGQGYATEAAQAIVSYGFKMLNLHRIHARHLKSNAASGRVLQRVGMVYEGCLHEHIFKCGQFHDVEHYGLLARDWRAKQSTAAEQGAAPDRLQPALWSQRSRRSGFRQRVSLVVRRQRHCWD